MSVPGSTTRGPAASGDRAIGPGARLRRDRRATALAGGCLVAAWLLPLLTHLAGIDVILVPVIVVAAAALVRARTVLDQVVIAVAWLFGVLCAAGMVISWWPWGMHPVPVAGTALTALVLLAVVTGRRPVLRLRLNPADWVMLGAGAAVAGLALRQFVARDAVGRLALLAPGEDLARHFILYDAIGKLDGYAFLRPDSVASITPPGHANYPQGLHLTFAVLDRFWRSSPDAIHGPAAMDWFIWGNVVTFVCFLLAVVWAVRRVAGPALTTGRSLVVLGAAAGYLFFGDPVTIFLRGFPNELAGLALVAVAVALLARPLRSTREQLAVLAALLVAVGFTYYLFLPVVAVAVLGWLVTYRAKVLRRPVTLAIAVAFSALAAVPALDNPAANRGSQLLLRGTAIPVSGRTLLAALLVIAAGLTTGYATGGRPLLGRYPWRMLTGALLAALGVAGSIIGYRYLRDGGGVPYYGQKALHLVLVVGIVGLGAATGFLPRFATQPRRPSDLVRGSEPGAGPARGAEARSAAGRRRVPARWWRGARPLVPAAALALAALAAFGGIVGPPSSSAGGSYGMGLVRGREGVRRDGPATAYWASRQFPDGAGRVTVDLSHGDWANFYGTLYGLAMQRTYVSGVDWYGFLLPGKTAKTVQDVERQVQASPGKLRFVVGPSQARPADAGSPDAGSFAGSFETCGSGDDANADCKRSRTMTNAEVARYLAAKYPQRVEVVTLAS